MYHFPVFCQLPFNHFRQIAHNVLGIRRFGQVIGLCEANVPAQNVAERKPHKGACADCGFSEPVADRKGGGAYTVCYMLLRFFHLIFILIIKIVLQFIILISTLLGNLKKFG